MGWLFKSKTKKDIEEWIEGYANGWPRIHDMVWRFLDHTRDGHTEAAAYIWSILDETEKDIAFYILANEYVNFLKDLEEDEYEI